MTCTNKEQKTILKYELKETAIDIFSGTHLYSVFQVMQELQKGFEDPLLLSTMSHTSTFTMSHAPGRQNR